MGYFCYNYFSHRGVAQLVARAVWDREVVGSSPITPTKKYKVVERMLNFFIVMSSTGWIILTNLSKIGTANTSYRKPYNHYNYGQSNGEPFRYIFLLSGHTT